MTLPALPIEFCLHLSRTHAKLTRKLDRSLSAHGISFTEYRILDQLGQSEGQALRRIDLAEELSLSASGITRLLSPMEKIGLVEKETNQRDARVSLVKLAPGGAKVLAEATQSLNDRAEDLLNQVEPNRLSLALEVLAKLGG